MSMWKLDERIEVTSNTSATMHQLRFKVIIPKNMSPSVPQVWCVDNTDAPQRVGALMANPAAQMSGSALSDFALSFWDKTDPRGTPIKPLNIIAIPNWKDTLENKHKLVFTSNPKV